METFYKAYTKTAQNISYYFVKKYLSFPEYNEVEDILEGYGMHTDFNKACDIAGIDNLQIRKQLFESMQPEELAQAKIIDLNQADNILIKKIVP